MNKKTALIIAACVTVFTLPACASMFGEEDGILMQILVEDIKQLAEVEQVLQTSQNNLALLREVNRGINDSLSLMRTISPHSNGGLYSSLRGSPAILDRINLLYGTPVASPDAQTQINVDRSVAEAISMNNDISDYTRQIDDVGEEIKNYSHSVSPGGAAKLTAQSMGVMLHVLNEQLRAQGALLKLQAQGLAVSNKKDKDQSAEFLGSANALATSMQSATPTFERPRF